MTPTNLFRQVPVTAKMVLTPNLKETYESENTFFSLT